MSVTTYQGSSVSNTISGPSADLGRLVIQHETSSTSGFVGQIQAKFNPNKLSFNVSSTVKSEVNASPSVDEQKIEQTSFVFQPATLTIALLFDTAEEPGKSVLALTTKVVALMRAMPKESRPPLCQLWWGKYLLLQGYLTSLGQEYTLFSPDGTPVRANLNCTFTESGAYKSSLSRSFVGFGQRLYFVMLGDTLQSISTKVYGTANRWRDIALYNKISNPRLLLPGRLLGIPV